MAEPIPKTSKQWRVTGYDGFDSLKFSEEAIPTIGDNEVLVKSKCIFSYKLIPGNTSSQFTGHLSTYDLKHLFPLT